MNKLLSRTAVTVATGCLAAAGFAAPASASPAQAAAPSSAGKHATDSIIVKFKSGLTSAKRSAVSDLVDATGIVSTIKGTGAVTLRVPGNAEAAVKRLNASPSVEYAELNAILTTQATPDDAKFGELYGLHNTGQGGGTEDADIDAPEGWDAAGLGEFPSSGGAKVGIVDTGIDTDHEEFAAEGKIAECGGVTDFGFAIGPIIIGGDPTIADDPAKCEDDNGHGTHVAGTIGATTNNGVGVAGVAPDAELAVCKALSGEGSGTLDMVANCITWLSEKDADIISMSLGGSSGSDTLQTAVKNATDNGSLIIAAAGNGGNEALNYPAAYEEAVSVGATDNKDAFAEFSTYNEDVEVSAPGVDIVSTWNDGAYYTASGTSMATPHAAGVAAVIAAQKPDGGPDAWRSKLTEATDDLGDSGRDVHYGFGRVNLQKAIS